MHTGFFITFEGGEGSGKTTQINKVAEILTAEKHKVVTTREPGGTNEGEKIRHLMVQRDGGNWTPMAECLMMFAARAMHAERVIMPQLTDGKIVISDRFTDSTRAYQGYARGVDLNTIESINNLVLDGLKPDLTIILDIDPEDGLKRSERRLVSEAFDIDQMEDRFEQLDIALHKKIRQGFLDIAAKEPERCIVIDATQPVGDITHQIKDAVLKRLAE